MPHARAEDDVRREGSATRRAWQRGDLQVGIDRARYGLAGRQDAFNPAELLLAALAACMIKEIERVSPILRFGLRSVEVRLSGIRDVPPRMESITCEILVDTDETDDRLRLLHDNVRKYGTVFNTVSPGTDLEGTLRRLARDA